MDEWNVNWPPNATVALTTFRKIALGEFIDTKKLGDTLLEFFGLNKLEGVVVPDKGRQLKVV